MGWLACFLFGCLAVFLDRVVSSGIEAHVGIDASAATIAICGVACFALRDRLR